MKSLTICTLLLLSFSALAQTPKPKMSYYDSLVDAQTRSNRPIANPTDSSRLRPDNPGIRYSASASDLPSVLWYGTYFSDQKVKLRNFPMDSLPDEVNIRIVRKDEDFCFPVKNIITSPYGWRWNRPHRGVDILLNTGDPVHCCFPGVVRIAKPMGGYGNLVVVRHYNGLETVYGHLSKINVKPRQVVQAGEVIGLGGSTGHSTGPHLHFEVRFQYEPFDPEWILDFKTYSLRTHRLHLDKTYFGITPPKGRHADFAYKADKSYVKEKPPTREVYHEVKGEDTWEDIAARYGTTPDRIKGLNNGLKKLVVGARIRVR